MLTGKQKRQLRSIAHNLSALFQVGKDGVNENMLEDILTYLSKHEILKISVLKNCSQSMEEIVSKFESYGMEVAQVIGRTVVVYKQSDDAINPIKL